MSDGILAWHFVGHSLRDGRPVPRNGETLRHEGSLKMCKSGLHASAHPYDALRNAPGETLCRVRCGGELIHGPDKLVCRERTIVARIDATGLLRAFARAEALRVAHLWDAPAVVRQYLETGEESLRAAAREASWAPAAATVAAEDAAAPTRDAAARAACTAARAADSAAYVVAARNAARAAASAAYDAAAEAASWEAASDAAEADAWFAAGAAVRARFAAAVHAAFGEEGGQ